MRYVIYGTPYTVQGIRYPIYIILRTTCYIRTHITLAHTTLKYDKVCVYFIYIYIYCFEPYWSMINHTAVYTTIRQCINFEKSQERNTQTARTKRNTNERQQWCNTTDNNEHRKVSNNIKQMYSAVDLTKLWYAMIGRVCRTAAVLESLYYTMLEYTTRVYDVIYYHSIYHNILYRCIIYCTIRYYTILYNIISY